MIFYPNSYAATGNQTHVSLVAPLLRDLNTGCFTDWATATSARKKQKLDSFETTFCWNGFKSDIRFFKEKKCLLKPQTNQDPILWRNIQRKFTLSWIFSKLIGWFKLGDNFWESLNFNVPYNLSEYFFKELVPFFKWPLIGEIEKTSLKQTANNQIWLQGRFPFMVNKMFLAIGISMKLSICRCDQYFFHKVCQKLLNQKYEFTNNEKPHKKSIASKEGLILKLGKGKWH